MYKRITCDIALILVLFYAPWWATLVLAVIATFYFSSYYEVMVLGALFDILYGSAKSSVFGYSVFGFIVSVALFLLILRLKRELR